MFHKQVRILVTHPLQRLTMKDNVISILLASQYDIAIYIEKLLWPRNVSKTLGRLWEPILNLEKAGTHLGDKASLKTVL